MVSHDPTLPVGARLCRGCGYRLEGLVSGRCPECGRKFDKQDGRSFYSVSYRWSGALKLAMGVAWIPVVGAGAGMVGIAYSFSW